MILSEQQLNSIRALFIANNLELNNNFQFFQFFKDGGGNQHVICYQYLNNLRIFPYWINFLFNSSGEFLIQDPQVIRNTNLNSVPSQNQSCVLTKFVDEMRNNYHYMDFESKCFEAEFGYYDLNADKSSGEAKLIKAWKVKVKDQEYPYAYISDVDLSILSSSSGIIIN